MTAAQAPSFLKLFPKQFDVFNLSIAPPPVGALDITPRVLVSGGRMTGKTIAIVHRIMRHLWETPGARAAIFSRTIKVAKDGGIWEDIMDAAREWCAAGLTDPQTGAMFEFTTQNSSGEPGPRIDSQTRTLLFKVRNRFGGESELKLFSLDHDDEVEAKVKSTRFSLIWFSELNLYQDPKVMKVSYLQLRMKHLKPWQHLWIGDTNPHEDGEDHWIYKTWWTQRLQDEKDVRAEMKKDGVFESKLEETLKDKMAFRRSLKLIEIFLDDNIFLEHGHKVALMEQYNGDTGEFARNVNGQWVKGHGRLGAHFANYFFDNQHIVGGNFEGDSIDLPPATTDLICGWDIGDVNHSWHAIESREIDGVMCWCIHEEHVIIGQELTVSEFTMEVMEKMEGLQSLHARTLPWRTHWSDSSSLDVWKSSGSGGSQSVEVETTSQGRIRLLPALKHSVKSRVRLLQYLLRKNRLFVAHRCERTIQMFRCCCRGSSDGEYVMNNEHKHPFDSLTYAIYMEVMHNPEMAYVLGGKPKAVKSGVTFKRMLGSV